MVPAKEAIRAQGRSIAWLARKLGTERAYLSRQLDGKRTLSRERAQRLADLTSLPVQIFLPDEPRSEVA